MNACKNCILREEEKRERIGMRRDYILRASTVLELMVAKAKREKGELRRKVRDALAIFTEGGLNLAPSERLKPKIIAGGVREGKSARHLQRRRTRR